MSQPLINAICVNDINEVKRLLTETPILVNQVILNGYGYDLTPIHYTKSIEMLKVLIDMGADINTQTRFGDTLLIRLSYGSFSEFILFLINYGADVNIVNNEGTSILHNIIMKIQYLSTKGVNDPTTNTIYKLLLDKSDKFCDTRNYKFDDLGYGNYADLLMKNNVILPFLVTHPEAFNKMFTRPYYPTERRYSEYLRSMWNITFDELRSAAGEMARERRKLLLNAFLRARRARVHHGVVAVTSAVAVVSAPPVASAVAAVSAPPVASAVAAVSAPPVASAVAAVSAPPVASAVAAVSYATCCYRCK